MRKASEAPRRNDHPRLVVLDGGRQADDDAPPITSLENDLGPDGMRFLDGLGKERKHALLTKMYSAQDVPRADDVLPSQEHKQNDRRVWKRMRIPASVQTVLHGEDWIHTPTVEAIWEQLEAGRDLIYVSGSAGFGRTCATCWVTVQGGERG